MANWKKVVLVEGVTDAFFIASCLKIWNIVSACDTRFSELEHADKGHEEGNDLLVYSTGGKAAIHGAAIRGIAELKSVKTILIIGDANGALAQNRKKLESAAAGWDTSALVSNFLLPDNLSPGNLETLLRNVATAHGKKDGIFACFDNYKKCLDALPCQGTYDDKDGIRAYCTLNRIEKDLTKMEYSQYPDHWDFTSPTLAPLKKFLATHL